jgi:hypothetical protein
MASSTGDCSSRDEHTAGRLLSTIEAVGLPRGQEEAIKHLTKNITFQQQFLLEEIVNTMDDNRGFKFKYGSRYEYDTNE